MQWPKKRIDNTMAKEKDRQYNGQRKGQTIQWPKKRIDNTMAKEKGQIMISKLRHRKQKNEEHDHTKIPG